MGHETPADHGKDVAGGTFRHAIVFDEDGFVGASGEGLILGQDIGQERDGFDPATLPALIGNGDELYALGGREVGQRPKGAGVNGEQADHAGLFFLSNERYF